MGSVRQLIIAVQLLAGGVAIFRVVYHIIMHLTDDDKRERNRKISNTIKMFILIELIVGLGEIIQKYYS